MLIHNPRESGGEGKEEAALRRPGFPQHCGRREERVELREGSEGLLPGRPGDAVFYIREGKVKVCVVSEQGKEAVVALHGNGDFFGESCLNGHPLRMATVVTMTECVIMRLEKAAIVRVLHDEPKFCRTYCLGTPVLRKTWWTSSSIRARSVWQECSF